MKMGKLIFLPLLILISQTCLAQEKNIVHSSSPVDFFKEEIKLTVNDSAASVSGIYYFRNNTERDGRMPIVFPFYVDDYSLYPYTIAAYMVIDKDTTRLDFRQQKTLNAIWLGIPLTPKGITIWHLDYRQMILSPKATYILTSTAAWGKPLEGATYRFIVPAKFDSVSTWPEADSINSKGETREYLARRTNFMPTQNMEIDWKSK